MAKRKRTWYEKLLRILRKHRLSTCQQIEVASYLGIELVDVEEYEPEPPRRRDEQIHSEHVPLYAKASAEVREWLDDLVKARWITGRRSALVNRLLEFLKGRPALVAEALGKDDRGGTGAPGSVGDTAERPDERTGT